MYQRHYRVHVEQNGGLGGGYGGFTTTELYYESPTAPSPPRISRMRDALFAASTAELARLRF